MGNDSLENVLSDYLKKVLEESFGVSLDVLKQYADAHKAGMALTVLCRPGDALYQVDSGETGIEELVCDHIGVVNKGETLCPVVIAKNSIDSEKVAFLYPDSFGMYVFTERSDAVAALRRKLRCGMCMSGEFQQYSPECETCQYNKNGNLV